MAVCFLLSAIAIIVAWDATSNLQLALDMADSQRLGCYIVKVKRLVRGKVCYISSKGARVPGLSNGESLLRAGLISCFLPLLFTKGFFFLHPVRPVYLKSTAFEKGL